MPFMFKSIMSPEHWYITKVHDVGWVSSFRIRTRSDVDSQQKLDLCTRVQSNTTNNNTFFKACHERIHCNKTRLRPKRPCKRSWVKRLIIHDAPWVSQVAWTVQFSRPIYLQNGSRVFIKYANLLTSNDKRFSPAPGLPFVGRMEVHNWQSSGCTEL